MKTVILIIIIRGWGGESVAVHNVEMNSMDSCNQAIAALRQKEKLASKTSMKYLDGNYICVTK